MPDDHQTAAYEWRCTPLGPNEDASRPLTLEQLRDKAAETPGLYLLYGFTEHVLKANRTPGNGALALSEGLFGKDAPLPVELETSALPATAADQPTLPADRLHLFLPRDPRGDAAQGLYNLLRVALVHQQPQPIWFLLTGAGVWDALHHSPGSQLAVVPRVYEYLFWDQGR